jgi:methylglutaconyl-CoA hydratase
VVNTPVTDAVVEDTAQRIASIRATPEGQEGIGAFLEKRPAAWARAETVS